MRARPTQTDDRQADTGEEGVALGKASAGQPRHIWVLWTRAEARTVLTDQSHDCQLLRCPVLAVPAALLLLEDLDSSSQGKTKIKTRTGH